MNLKNAWIIARRDFRSYFTSPIAYVILALFLGILGFMFFNMLATFNEQAMNHQAFKNTGKALSLSEGVVRPLYLNMNVLLLIISPIFTMRLFAEERKNQTIQLLLTSPVTLAEIVFGKFLSSFLFLLVLFAITLVYPAILAVFGKPDLGVVASSLIGTLLLSACFLSSGTLFSAMTENQIIAFLLTFVTNFFLWIISWAAYSAGAVWSDIITHLSLVTHLMSFVQGTIGLVDVVYYLSFIFFGLFLAHRVLDSYRWR